MIWIWFELYLHEDFFIIIITMQKYDFKSPDDIILSSSSSQKFGQAFECSGFLYFY